MSEAKKKRLNELLKKILEEKKPLNESEMKEFKGLLDELYKEREKKKTDIEPLKEVIDRSMMISLGENALKVHQSIIREEQVKAFNKLPLKDKAKHLEKKISDIEKSHKKWKQLSREEKDRQAKEDFDRFYEEHVRKYGNELW
jgi:argininosuccinate lyase